MRLFVGIALSPEVRQALETLLNRLRSEAHLRWSPAGNLHITMKFIGEWPADRVEEVTRTLGGVPAPAPVDVAIRGLGWFPNPHSPRVFWAGVEAGPELEDLARATEARLEAIGIPPENRAFSPHLTLARVGQERNLAPLLRAVASLDSVDFGSFRAGCFHLYSSEQSPTGSRYRPLADFPLGKQ